MVGACFYYFIRETKSDSDLEGLIFTNHFSAHLSIVSKIVSEYDQEIPQSQTADSPVAPRGRAAQPSRDTRKTN